MEVTGGAGYNKPYGRFCGRDLPDAITSDSNSLQVKFNSDDSVQSTGFQAEYFIGTQNQNDLKKKQKKQQHVIRRTGHFSHPFNFRQR